LKNDHIIGGIMSRIPFTLAAALLCAGTTTALAQGNWPTRSVTLVYSLSPGSAADIEVRRYTKIMQDNLAQSFVIDFKPGASGVIANSFVVKAKPDGYTYLLSPSTLSMLQATKKALPYDTQKDLAPVSLLTKRAMLLVAAPKFAPNNYAEYVAYARANPGKINWATAAQGGATHLVGAWLHNATNTEATFVHYKGAAGYTTEMLANRVDVGLLGVSSAKRHIDAGKLKLLFIATANRLKAFPNVVTVAESGVPGFEYPSWLGVLAPAGTPAAIVNRFSAEARRAVHSGEIADALEADAITPVGSTPQEFAKTIADDITRTRKIASDNKITFND
jgi:tripartite-type tricarboxylate transporter receptor subunit TctC